MLTWLTIALALAQDTDGDGVLDSVDDCPSVANPVQGALYGPRLRLPALDRWGATRLVAGDLNGDGRDDLVAAIDALDYNDAGWATYLQQADGSFATALTDPAHPFPPRDLALGDLDGDGDLDLLSSDDTTWYRNDGTGAFTTATSITWINDIEITAVTPIDLDGDGDLDLAMAGSVVEYGYVLYRDDLVVQYAENLGGGSFALERDLYVRTGSSSPTALVAADVNGDGDADLLLADPISGTATWLERTSPFTVVAHALPTASVDPTALAVGDLDGDGDLDVALASCADDRISWLEAVPGGAVEHLIGTGLDCPSALAVADLDQDGDPDLHAAGRGGAGWAENFGAATFGAPKALSPSRSEDLVVADLDDNGAPDVIVGEWHTDRVPWFPALHPADTDHSDPCDVDDPCPLDPAAVCVDGDGDRLSDGDELALGTDPLDADTDGDGLADGVELRRRTDPTDADTDGDGVPDGADPCPLGDDPDVDGVCGVFDDCPLDPDPLQLDGDGDGHGDACDTCIGAWNPAQGVAFSEALEVAPGTRAAPADLDGDGWVDVIASDHTADTLSWLRNLGPGVAPPVVLGVSATQVRPADLDGDGDVDIVTASVIHDHVAWVENLGAGAFAAQRTLLALPEGPDDVHVFDVDSDGLPELYLSGDGDLYELANLGGGAFGAAVPVHLGPSPFNREEWFHDADLDGDGDRELVSGGSYADQIRIYPNLAGTLGAPIELTVDGPGSVSSADLDCDGRADLVIGRPFADRVVWMRNLGGLAFGPAQTIETAVDGAGAVVPVDIDHDGDPDLVYLARFDDEVRWARNDGGGSFTAALAREDRVSAGNRRLFPVDFDHDGGFDLFVSGNRAEVFASVAAPDGDRDGICDADDPAPTVPAPGTPVPVADGMCSP